MKLTRGYMMMNLVNEIELYLLIGAFLLSKHRVLPAMLTLYALLYQLMAKLSGSFLSYCNKAFDASVAHYEVPTQSIIDRCDNNLMTVYIFEGAMMFLISLLFVFMIGRLAKVTFLVVAVQAMLSLLMAICVYVVNMTDNPMGLAFDLHYSINSIFAIIYIVIAWTCVYLSWRESS